MINAELQLFVIGNVCYPRRHGFYIV